MKSRFLSHDPSGELLQVVTTQAAVGGHGRAPPLATRTVAHALRETIHGIGLTSIFGGNGSIGEFGGGGGGGQQGNGGSSGYGSGAGGGGKTANGGNSNLSAGAGGAPEGGGGGVQSGVAPVSGAALGGGGGAAQRDGNAAGAGGVAGGGGGAGGGNLAGAGGLGGGGGGGGPFISGNGGPGGAGGHFGGGGGNSATSGAIGGAGGFGGGGGGGATNVGSPSVGSAGGSGGFGAGSGGGGTGAGVAGTYAGTGGFGNTGSGGGGGAALGGAFFVAPGGTLTINGMTSSSLTGTFSVTGGAAGAGGTTPATAGQALGQYLFVGTGGNTTLNVASGQAVTLGDSSNPFVISNAIAGSSGTLTKSGSGTLRIYGVYQNFNSSTIAVTGGTLGGTFTLSNSALSVSNGGKLSPGNASAGVMVVGSLSLAANSVLEFDLGVPNGGPGNASDTIFVTGTLPSIGANTVLNVTAVNQFAAGTYSIIEYHGAGIPSAGGLTVGTMPAGYAGSISTSGTGPYYINLVVTNAYTVTYDGNGNTGGTVPTDSTGYASNASVTVLGNTGNLTKTGYTFAGWTTVANGGTDFGASFNITANTTLYAKWTVAAVNGVCGTVSATSFKPTTGLCTTGTLNAAGVIKGASSWTWACDGSGGGNSTAANACSAAFGQTAPNSGGAAAQLSGGTWAFAASGTAANQTAGFIPTTGHVKSPPSLPPGFTFPHGLFDFVLDGGGAGTTATITISYPAAIPAGSVYWKYGPSPAGYNCSGAACATAHWYQMPPAQAVIAGNTITLTITDGGVGDDDLTANGTIVDQGGPGVPGGATGIPTLSEWGLIFLSSLMAMFGLWQTRRREGGMPL